MVSFPRVPAVRSRGRGQAGTARHRTHLDRLSRSTRRRDLSAKWEIYAEAGVPSYWLVDPVEPSLTVLTLTGGLYVETARVSGTEPLTVQAPFPVTVRLLRS